LALTAQAGVPWNDFIAGGSSVPVRHLKVQDILHRTGAITYEDIAGENAWWRLLTCCFVHIGLLHLLVNMYSLYVVGPLLERMWGRWRFLVLYLSAGLVGSCAMVLFTTPPFLGAGAS